jgi:hypothetical protein
MALITLVSGISFLFLGTKLMAAIKNFPNQALAGKLRIVTVIYTICFTAESVLWVVSSIYLENADSTTSNIMIGLYLLCDVCCLISIFVLFKSSVDDMQKSYNRTKTGSIDAVADSGSRVGSSSRLSHGSQSGKSSVELQSTSTPLKRASSRLSRLNSKGSMVAADAILPSGERKSAAPELPIFGDLSVSVAPDNSSFPATTSTPDADVLSPDSISLVTPAAPDTVLLPEATVVTDVTASYTVNAHEITPNAFSASSEPTLAVSVSDASAQFTPVPVEIAPVVHSTPEISVSVTAPEIFADAPR